MDRKHSNWLKKEKQFRDFLKEKQRDGYWFFSGRKITSKEFVITRCTETSVFVRNIGAKKEVELSITLMMKGIIIHPHKFVRTTDYAEMVEESQIKRKNSNSVDTLETKYYFTLHNTFRNAEIRGFLKPVKE